MHRVALLISDKNLHRLGEALKPHVSTDWSFWPISIDCPIPELLDQLRTWQITGIICEYRPDLTEILSSLHKPLVMILADLMIGGSVCVNVDDYEVGKIAAHYFHEKGIRSYAAIGANALHAQEKQRGYEETLESKGFTIGTYEIDSETLQREHVNPARLEEWLKELPKPVGIFMGDAPIARLLIQLSQALEIPIPESIALLSGDGTSIEGELIYPSISSIEIPWKEITQTAINWIQRLTDGEDPPEETVLIKPKGIHTRASTDFFVTQDPLINKALAFLRERRNPAINVQELVHEIGCDRRTFERTCRDNLNSTPLNLIRRHRLQRAREELEHSNLPLSEVAAQCGFSAQDKLSKAFKKTFGETPLAWRKKHRLKK